MIKQLFIKNVRNVKGEKTVNLTGLDLFVGRNGTGKSTCLDTVPLVVLGYNPEAEGKNHESVFQDSNSDSMTVGLIGDKGDFRRTFFRDKKGSISQTLSIDGEEVGKSEGHRIIQEALGDNVVLFNITEFLAMSDDKKKEFILQLGIKEDVDVIRGLILEALLREISGELDGLLKYKYKKEFSELTETELTETIDVVVRSVSDEHRRAVIEGTIRDFQTVDDKKGTDYIQAIAKRYNSDLNAHRKLGKEFEITVKRLNGLMLQKESGSQTIAEVKAEIDKITEEVGKINTTIGINRNNVKIVGDSEARIERVEKLLDEFKKENVPDKEIPDIEKNLAKVVEYSGLLCANVFAREDAKRVLSGYQVKLDGIEDISKKQYCVVDKEIKCPVDFGGYIDALHDDFSLKESELENIESDINDLNDKIIKEFSKEALPIGAFLKRLEHRLKELQGKKIELEANIKAYTKELTELRSRDLSEFAPVDEDVLVKQKDGWIAQKEILNTQLETLQRIKQATSEISQAELSTVITQTRIEIDKLMIASIKKVRNNLLGDLFEPVKKIMNSLLAEINPQFAFDIYLNDNDKLVMGWQKEDGFTPFERLSKGEGIIYAVALITALYQFLNPPLKALCVKVAELDSVYFQQLLKGLSAMKKHFDNILVEYPHAVENAEGWQVFRMGED